MTDLKKCSGKRLALFLVLHSRESLLYFKTVIKILTREIHLDLRVVLIISKSSGINSKEVLNIFDGIEGGGDIIFYEDDFFDYSAYISGLEFISNDVNEYDGFIFINDTISKKHKSNYLLRLFSKKVNDFSSRDLDFKFMTGPFGDGEFFFKNPGDIKYIPTYCFFVSSNSFFDILNILKKTKLLKDFFNEKANKAINKNENDKYVGFFEMHKSQLKDRNFPAEKIENKLVTAILEKEISNFYKENGILVFCDYGIKSRIIVKFQKLIGVLLNKF